MEEKARDDIWYRGSYRPTEAGEYRVMLSDSKVWLVDRSWYNPTGQLTWVAQDHDSAQYKATLSGFAQIRQLLSTQGIDTGFFIPEQLCQLGANIAGRRSESHGDAPSVCGELARAMVQTLIAMPLTQAMTNLVMAQLMPDNSATVQAQLLLHAAYHAGSSDALGRAIELRETGTVNWLTAQDLSAMGDITRQLHLSSPDLIKAMRRDLDKQQLNSDGSLRWDWCHFPEGTLKSAAVAWLDRAANLPIEPPNKSGTIRVVENWITGQLDALIQDGDRLKPVDSTHRATTAISAYAAAIYDAAHPNSNAAPVVTHMGGYDFVDASANPFGLNKLHREAIAQRAAHLSRFQLAPSAEAAKNAAHLAHKEVATYFRVVEELWTPREQAEATDNPSGSLLMREMKEQTGHALTRHGIAHMVSLYRQLADQHQHDDVQCRQTADSVSFQVPLNDAEAQLKHRTTPLARLAVVGESFMAGVDAFDPMTEENKASIIAAANLTQFDFLPDDGPAFAHETPHRYTIKLITERRDGGDDHEEPVVDDETDTLEADELIRLVRDKGITRSPTVEQYGDGSWRVSYRSESPEENRAYFERNIETYYTLHLEEVNGQPVNPENAQVFADEVGLNFHNPYEPKVSRLAMPRFG